MNTEITEQALFEALGLGEQGQEPAEPAAPEGNQEPAGGKEQEPAEPAREEAIKAPEPEPVNTDDSNQPREAEGVQEGQPKTLTPEQRRENAARRRKAETEAAVNAALEQERKKQEMLLKDVFAKAGLKNTATGQPITTMEEFNAWSGEFERARLQRELKAGKLTEEGLASAIGNHPAVQKAQELVAREEQARQQRADQEAKARIDGEIARIHELDASINTVEDLFAAPYGQELYAMVKRGYSLTDAHYLLNRETLEKAREDAIRVQAAAAARSKAHLTPAAAVRGGGSVAVPAEELGLFRAFNPNATDAEIQAYYNKTLK